MATARPVSVHEPEIAHPADDGLFGPQSVTWRVMARPASSIGIGTAVLMQMIHPRVLRMIDQASTVRQDPEKRARLTGEYGLTVNFGDTAAAERAGEVLRNIHAHRTAVDPITGVSYRADEPDLLLWVHATIVWAVLAANQRWGPPLSRAERDQFVDEQRQAARLVGLDPETVPRNVAELDAYMARMQPQLAYVTETKFIRELMVPPRLPFSIEGLVHLVASRAAVDLLPDPIKDLYGFRWQWLNHLAVQLGSLALLTLLKKTSKPYEKLLPELRAQSAIHAFGSQAKRQRQASQEG